MSIKLKSLSDWIKSFPSDRAGALRLGISSQRLSGILRRGAEGWYILERPDGTLELLRQKHIKKGA